MIDSKEKIIEQLDTLIRLQAYSLTYNIESQREKILFLHRSGLGPTAIAGIIGSTPNSVNVALSNARKKGDLEKS